MKRLLHTRPLLTAIAVAAVVFWFSPLPVRGDSFEQHMARIRQLMAELDAQLASRGPVTRVAGERAVFVTVTRVDRATLDRLLDGWMSEPREASRKMIDKYGPPDEATSKRLIWHNNGPWKHTILVNEMIPHDFPMPHHDMLYQAINYRIPPDRADESLRYDGSVILERTKGEIAARCDKEEMNFLALNLADEVTRGKRSVDDARKLYAKTAMEFKQGKSSPYVEGFLFPVSKAEQGDPDRPVTP